MIDRFAEKVAATIRGIAGSTGELTTRAEELNATQQAAGNLSRLAAELTALVNEFKY